ncbi:MAG: ATP-binding protein [Coriobacteriia bacterium]
MKPGNPMPVELTKRHGQIVASESIRDVFDALRELVTNSDDSYHRMGQKGGRIVVEIERHRGGAPSIIRIRDRAQGMTLDEMKSKIRRVGDRTSSAGIGGSSLVARVTVQRSGT